MSLYPIKPARWADLPEGLDPGPIEPSEAKKGRGFFNNEAVPAATHNWIWFQNAFWIRALRAAMLLKGWLPASGDDTVGGGSVFQGVNRQLRVVRACVATTGVDDITDLTFVAAGENGSVFITSQGHPQKSWDDRTQSTGLAGYSSTLFDVAYNPGQGTDGRIVLVGASDGLFSSDDKGLNFAANTPGGTPGGTYLSIAYSPVVDRYVMVGVDGAGVSVQDSSDGLSFNDQGVPGAALSLSKVIFDHVNAQFVISGSKAGNFPYIARSATGLVGSWVEGTVPAIASAAVSLAIGDVFEDGGNGVLLAALGDGTTLLKSIDGGVSFATVALPADNTVTFSNLRYGAGGFIATNRGGGPYGDNPSIGVSVDGERWSPGAMPFDQNVALGRVQVHDVCVVDGDNIGATKGFFPGMAVAVGYEITDDRVYIAWNQNG